MPRVQITEAASGRDAAGFLLGLNGASVQVDVAGGAAATVYEAETGGATISNPVTSENGRIPGWLEEGAYDLTVTYNGQEAAPVRFEARAAYPAGGTEGQLLAVAPDGGVEWVDVDAITAGLPWTIDINPFTAPATQTNWNTIQAGSSSQIFGGYKVTTGAQNAEIGWDVVLAAGTWTLSLLHATGIDVGIYTASLDGVSIGTIDGYAASGVNNVVSTITGITVAPSGKKRLLLKMATKNATSTSYLARISGLRLLRTA